MVTSVIIPARGGSKRFPKKNMAILNGKPLICHTIEAAIGRFDNIIFTSDSEELLDIAGKYNGVQILIRPEHLSNDTSKVIETVQWIFDINSEIWDQIWLCLPTCPLRSVEDIYSAQNMLTESFDSVVSITDFEFPPELGLIWTKDGEIVDNNPNQPFKNNNTRSQDCMKIYRPNGALYGSWTKSFKKYRNSFSGRTAGYYMPRSRSVDIDNQIDLAIAEILSKNI